MSEFANPFPGGVAGKKMGVSELVRAIRLDLSSEQEVIHLYTAQAEATDHPLARRVLNDIADEERRHAGEFLRLLQLLAGDEEKLLARGVAEVDRMAASLAKPVEVIARMRERKSPETL